MAGPTQAPPRAQSAAGTCQEPDEGEGKEGKEVGEGQMREHR